MADDLHHERPANQLQRMKQEHNESNTMLAIMMAGIAALFILAIVGAFTYAWNDNIARMEGAPQTAGAPATTGMSGRPAETTGSGQAEPQRREQEDRSPDSRR